MTLRSQFSLLFILLSCPAQFHIIDGEEDVTIERSPHTVAILKDRKYECVGSIVSANSVVTVIHCVNEMPECEHDIVAGATNIYREGQRRKVLEVIRYYEPFSEPSCYDLAVVKVHIPFDLNDATVKKIELNDRQSCSGSTMQITAWVSSTRYIRRRASRLLKTKPVRIQDSYYSHSPRKLTINAEPNEWFGESGTAGVVEGQLCAVAQDSCSKVVRRVMPCIYIHVTDPSVRTFITSNM